jgi:spermidine synthase
MSEKTNRILNAVLYVGAFVDGAIVMSFEMLGSRYLHPYFGSGIYTWAALISTVLVALTAGYFAGGFIADRVPSPKLLGGSVALGSAYLIFLPSFAGTLLQVVSTGILDVRLGAMLAALALMFFPAALLGVYSPFAIRLFLGSIGDSKAADAGPAAADGGSDATADSSGEVVGSSNAAVGKSGAVSGAVYGVSTIGSIVGTLGTSFFLIPLIGTRLITVILGIVGILMGGSLLAVGSLRRFRAKPLLSLAFVLCLLSSAAPRAGAEDPVDSSVRSAMLARDDGQIAHLESEYNDIFVMKRGDLLTLSFQLGGLNYTESIVNLKDASILPIRYTQVMTVALAYPREPKAILMIGLGGGSIPTYLGHYLPDATIETVEIDPGVISATKKYFGFRETSRVTVTENDGRVFLARSAKSYDLILIDAYLAGYVPFHLLTSEFYTLIKGHLTSGGAAVFNVHEGTRLYTSTVSTLQSVFTTVDLYPTRVGEVAIVVSDGSSVGRTALDTKAAALQKARGFRYPLSSLLQMKSEERPAAGKILTDDFAPVEQYDTIRE